MCKELAWAGPVTIRREDDGIVIHCDLWYVADSVQEDAHGSVVDLCSLLLSLFPEADIAACSAINADGTLAGAPIFPIAQKRIPRKNLPASCTVNSNRRWLNLISNRIAAQSYSEYLTAAADILKQLVPTLEKIFDAPLRCKASPDSRLDILRSLHHRARDLALPAESSVKMEGMEETEPAKLRSLLIDSSCNLCTRFLDLPKQAGSYIAWLNDFMAKIDHINVPWQLIESDQAPLLKRLKTLLETLQMLAGEAHERQEVPPLTWKILTKAHEGNALQRISYRAKEAGEKRLALRKEGFERSAKENNIDAVFYLKRSTTSAVLPWPPADVLALLHFYDIIEAAELMESRA